MNRPALTVEYFARLFAAERVRWVIAGALAANVYRLQVRTTTDLDLLLDLSEHQYASIRTHLEAQSWQVHPAGGEPPEPPDVVRLRHADYFPTDLLVAKTDYQRVAIGRARVLKVATPSVAVPYLSPEDVLVQKLIAYRFRDRDDLENMLKAGISLDEKYVARWCEEWGVRERWEELARNA